MVKSYKERIAYFDAFWKWSADKLGDVSGLFAAEIYDNSKLYDLLLGARSRSEIMNDMEQIYLQFSDDQRNMFNSFWNKNKNKNTILKNW